jgi:hypothetical protein
MRDGEEIPLLPATATANPGCDTLAGQNEHPFHYVEHAERQKSVPAEMTRR